MRVACVRCGGYGTGPEEWASRLDGMMIERWRCGMCGYATSIVKKSPRTSKRDRFSYIPMYRWVGSNQWVNP